MIWLVWRRQRAALLLASGILVVALGGLLVGRISVLDTAARLGVTECLRAYGVCSGTTARLTYGDTFNAYGAFALLVPLVLPGLVGVVAGAGLFGRELEQGTHVFALTQSLGRLRWFASGLLVAGLPVAVATALAGPALAWIRQPALALYTPTPLTSPVFESSGVLFPAYALLGFTLAAVGGLLLRNVLAAVVAVVVVQFALQIVLATEVRPYYLPPETAVQSLSTTGPVGGPPADAVVIVAGYRDEAGRPVPPTVEPCTGSCPGEAASIYTLYQPADRYWPFQAIEAGVLAVVAAAAVGAGVWALRRRLP